jgi:hypothetical protein
MAKNAYYFQHDYDPTGDPKIQALVGEYGATGYGIYWRLIEMLHAEDTNMMPKKKYVYLALSKQMLTDVILVEQIISDCINEFELFQSDESHFWSNRVFVNVKRREELREKRIEAGRKGGKGKKSDDPEEGTEPEANA